MPTLTALQLNIARQEENRELSYRASYYLWDGGKYRRYSDVIGSPYELEVHEAWEGFVRIVCSSGGEVTKEPGYVYMAQAGEYIKIGQSIYPEKRLAHIDWQIPTGIESYHAMKTDYMTCHESMLHGFFAHWHHRSEWFKLDSDIINQAKMFDYALEYLSDISNIPDAAFPLSRATLKNLNPKPKPGPKPRFKVSY